MIRISALGKLNTVQEFHSIGICGFLEPFQCSIDVLRLALTVFLDSRPGFIQCVPLLGYWPIKFVLLIVFLFFGTESALPIEHDGLITFVSVLERN